MAYIRKVKTTSGATAVQIAYKEHGQVKKIIHIGSAHTEGELQILLSIARKQMQPDQLVLFQDPQASLRLEMKRSFSDLLWTTLKEQYRQIGFSQLEDGVFEAVVLARIVEPTSKVDSLRVMADLGVEEFKKTTIFRSLSKVVEKDYRKTISEICFQSANQSGLSLVLYDVTTLYFETEEEDTYRKSGLSKERRLEPQIIIGLLVDHQGFPIALHSFEGNTAETKTILPVIKEFLANHGLTTTTIVADAAMMSKSNLSALSEAGYTYIVGSRLNKIPYDIAEYQKSGEMIDQQVIVSELDGYRVIYQYRAKRAALDLRNIEKQIAKAKKIIDGQIPTSRAKFLSIQAKTKQLNQRLITKAYALAGIKGYVTNLNIPAEDVIANYHQLFQVEATFRMAKSDLKARPIFHRKRDPIEAHLTVVFAALAIGRRIEYLTGLSIKQFVKLLRPFRSSIVMINGKEYLAPPDIPDSVKAILNMLNSVH